MRPPTARSCGPSLPHTFSTSVCRGLPFGHPRLRNCPFRGLPHHGVRVVAGRSLERRSILGSADVSERKCRVPHKAAALATFDRRAFEALAKALVVEGHERLKVEACALARLELGPAARAPAVRRRVVRAHFLAD